MDFEAFAKLGMLAAYAIIERINDDYALYQKCAEQEEWCRGWETNPGFMN
jgi:hypothetical protein